MADFIIRFIPAWFIFALAAVTMVHRFYVAFRWEWNVISRWENVLYAIALLNIAGFYLGVWLTWWDMSTSIAISRLVWSWLILASLYISKRMAKRRRNGLE